jgi:hypothetical protein
MNRGDPVRKIFVSYSSSNEQQVGVLLETLHQHDAVWSARKLSFREPWWAQIARRLRTCDLVVFAVSPEALESPGCMKELDYSRQLGKPILAVVIGGIENSILPLDLAAIPAIDWTSGDSSGRHELRRAVNRLARELIRESRQRGVTDELR